MGWYDTLILTKYKCKFFKQAFKTSYMQRGMLFAEILIKDQQNIIIGTMHYESLGGNQKIREQQMGEVQTVTNQCQRVIVAGDFNFGDGYD